LNPIVLTPSPTLANPCAGAIPDRSGIVQSRIGNNPKHLEQQRAPVKPDQVATARKETHPGPMTSLELLQIPVQ
jgi:hypothetical protein